MKSSSGRLMVVGPWSLECKAAPVFGRRSSAEDGRSSAVSFGSFAGTLGGASARAFSTRFIVAGDTARVCARRGSAARQSDQVQQGADALRKQSCKVRGENR